MKIRKLKMSDTEGRPQYCKGTSQDSLPSGVSEGDGRGSAPGTGPGSGSIITETSASALGQAHNLSSLSSLQTSPSFFPSC